MVDVSRYLTVLLLLVALATSAPAAEVQSTDFDLAALIRQVEEQYNGNSSYARVEMEVVSEHWRRQLTMDSWSLGRERFLIRILEPARERGVATLKVDPQVWNFLPKVDRVIRIPPSMMGGAWMGSHITNDDLVKANHIDEDYHFTLRQETDEIWQIDGTPRSGAAVVWGKIGYQIHKQPLYPLKVEYYDEEGALVRTILFDDVQQLGGRVLPLRMTVLPQDKPQEKTLMQYRELQFDIALTADFFSLAELKRRR